MENLFLFLNTVLILYEMILTVPDQILFCDMFVH